MVYKTEIIILIITNLQGLTIICETNFHKGTTKAQKFGNGSKLHEVTKLQENKIARSQICTNYILARE